MEKNMFYDKKYRGKVRQLDEDSLAHLMAEYASDVRIKVLTNTRKVTYIVIPADTSAELNLQTIQAGTDPWVSSTGCLASFGCASSTVSTAGTASSLTVTEWK